MFYQVRGSLIESLKSGPEPEL